MFTRRQFGRISLSALLAATGAAAVTLRARATSGGKFEIMRTPEEWRKLLTPEQYRVMRDHGTEAPFSSPLDKFYEPGSYNCAACDLPLYESTTKYDSRSGWPSFYAAIDKAIGTQDDNTLFYTRTEVHCRRCGGHLGHIFPDGPPPTGKRHCINGVALKFIAKPKSAI